MFILVDILKKNVFSSLKKVYFHMRTTKGEKLVAFYQFTWLHMSPKEILIIIISRETRAPRGGAMYAQWEKIISLKPTYT